MKRTGSLDGADTVYRNEVRDMQAMKITGGNPLMGAVRIPGAKNSVLPIMAAALLCEERVILHRVPHLSDVVCAAQILQTLGCRVLAADHLLSIEPSGRLTSEISPQLMQQMRSSVFFIAPLLARTGVALATVPGGCNLGARPIDIHLQGLACMGVQIERIGAQLRLTAPNGLHGAQIALRYPSVGATETLLMAACRAHGETILTGCSIEPEVVDLAHFLQKAGACIEGIGTRRLKIYGRDALHGVVHDICPDRIAAATVLFAVAACTGRVLLQDVSCRDLGSVLRILRRMGCNVKAGGHTLEIERFGELKAAGDLMTDVHPAFPTDAAPLAAAAMLRARGRTMLTDTVFEHRFACAQGFNQMRAACGTQGRAICIEGVRRMKGTQVHAPDLRGGAALVIAALQAEGESVVTGVEHIMRGYEDLAGMFVSLGAQAGYFRASQARTVPESVAANETVW